MVFNINKEIKWKSINVYIFLLKVTNKYKNILFLIYTMYPQKLELQYNNREHYSKIDYYFYINV